MAVLLLSNADPTRYDELISSLKRGANLGHDEYPTSVAEMYKLMVNYTRESGRTTNTVGNRLTGRREYAFAQVRATNGDSGYM